MKSSEIYRQQLRSELKLNLNSLEITRNLVVLVDNSKKIYSDYSRNNVNNPFDVRNIKSVLKPYLRSNTIFSNNNDSISESDDQAYEKNLKNNSRTSSVKIHDKDLSIKAKIFPIKDLNDKEREQKSLSYKKEYENQLTKEFKIGSYNYRNTKSSESIQHKGTIYNYMNRRVVKEINNINKINKSVIENETIDENTNLSNHTEIIPLQNAVKNFQKLVFSDYVSKEEKHLTRIKEARRKVFDTKAEKCNLNKVNTLFIH